MADEGQCYALVHQHSGNYPCAGRPRKYRLRRCMRDHRVVLLRVDGSCGLFCTQHSKLALEGYIDETGTMLDPTSMADYRRHEHLGRYPPERGVWARAVREVTGNASLSQ